MPALIPGTIEVDGVEYWWRFDERTGTCEIHNVATFHATNLDEAKRLIPQHITQNVQK